ncbi:hypothetical protein Rs2_19164 [Raphanus sativus]|nr:hypothetical protein Rs2_19164 [Raphanus sativus]
MANSSILLSDLKFELQILESQEHQTLWQADGNGYDPTGCKEIKSKESVTWSVDRPNTIFGFSPYNLMNIVGTLGVYAAICKHEGSNLVFPGARRRWEGFTTASEADLIAEQQIWAAVDPYAKWKRLTAAWGRFLLSSLGSRSMDSRKGRMWGGGDDEREREGLGGDGEGQLQEKKLDEVGVWWFAVVVLGVEGMIDSMNNSKENGFLCFNNSNNSFISWIDKYKAFKIVP